MRSGPQPREKPCSGRLATTTRGDAQPTEGGQQQPARGGEGDGGGYLDFDQSKPLHREKPRTDVRKSYCQRIANNPAETLRIGHDAVA